MAGAGRLPTVDLGHSVRHRTARSKAAGVVVGVLFRPRELVLVRWPDGAATFEAAGDIAPLVVPIGIPATLSAAEQIRQRITRGILPMTGTANVAPLQVTAWQPCDGCDEMIGPGHAAYVLTYSALRSIRMHRACYHLWEAERHRRQQPSPSQSTRHELPLSSAGVRCALCQEPILARQNVAFRVDGGVQHASCPAPVRKPLDRVGSASATEPICWACARPIEPADAIVKDGATLLHSDCFVSPPRPIAGGGALSAWTLLGDEHIGRRLGTTVAGHRDFMAACADVRWASAAAIARARRVVAATRAARRGSAA
jgi:hypothetical protein